MAVSGRATGRLRFLWRRSSGRTSAADPRPNADNTRVSRQSGWFRVLGGSPNGCARSGLGPNRSCVFRALGSDAPETWWGQPETHSASSRRDREKFNSHQAEKSQGWLASTGDRGTIGRRSRRGKGFPSFQRVSAPCLCQEGAFGSVPASWGLTVARLRAPLTSRGWPIGHGMKRAHRAQKGRPKAAPFSFRPAAQASAG